MNAHYGILLVMRVRTHLTDIMYMKLFSNKVNYTLITNTLSNYSNYISLLDCIY